MTDKNLTTSFYSHHSAWGSYSSFLLGLSGRGGGFVLNHVYPPAENIFIGYQSAGKMPKLLPFFSPEKKDLLTMYPDQSICSFSGPWCKENAYVFAEDEIKREIGFTTDTWRAGSLAFSLIVPLASIPDPAHANGDDARFYYNPTVFARIEFDNTLQGSDMTGIFSIEGMRRVLSDVANRNLAGVAFSTKYGMACRPEEGAREILAGDSVKAAFSGDAPVNRSATEGGFVFRIKPGEKKSFVIVLSTYQDGVVTTGKSARYFYTTLFKDLEDAMDYSLVHATEYLRKAGERDEELKGSGLNSDRKQLLAASAWSYCANTQLLIDGEHKPLFVVNEGEYQFINTLDLVIDHCFWETAFSPWTIRNILDQYSAGYSYRENDPETGEPIIGFCHDMGVANMFSPVGNSAYENADRADFSSYMTFEETCNWLLSAAIYSIRSKDKKWLSDNNTIIRSIFNSIKARDGNHDGVMDRDSQRCGKGAEVTTYDSLDASLSQARNNLYLAVKTWATFVCLSRLFALAGDGCSEKEAEEYAHKCSGTITSYFKKTEGYIPAVFEGNNVSRIIPAVEGLIYPYVIGDEDAVSENGRFRGFIRLLKKHLENVLVEGVCIDPVSGGWKLSSTSNNTWLSKIFVNQFVAQKILKIESDRWESWDRSHLRWEVESCGTFAATDQVTSDTGKDLGSRLYPRLVTSILWLRY